MAIDLQELINDTLALKLDRAAIVDTGILVFDEACRKACEANRCGSYNTSWQGPPAVGTIAECKARVLEFKQGLFFQYIHHVDTSRAFDYKGMVEGGEIHLQKVRDVLAMMRAKYPFKRLFPLNAGCCHLCGRCAYLDNEPCRLPDEAMASVEGYGIDVMRLQIAINLPYYNGKGTYTFVGMILFEE